MNKKHILLVCANPRSSDPLRSGEEDRVLRESVRLSTHRDSLIVTTLNAATIDDLRRNLLDAQAADTPYDIVHFSGHGTNRGLVFEDSSGSEFVPESAALAEILDARGVKVALFNACYSLAAGQITAGQLEHTIATTGPISDPAAIEFTRGFYDAVGAGLGIREAYQEGMNVAAVKHYKLATVFLSKGENYVAEEEGHSRSQEPNDQQRLLIGTLIDVSGSMEQSIRNDTGRAITRLEGASESIARFGRSMKTEIERASVSDASNLIRIFCYAFGTRTGDIVDLFSLFKGSQDIDIKKEISTRRHRYEAEAKRSASQYSGLASLARSHGFGSLVDSAASSLEADARRSIRNRITSEIAEALFESARKRGDTTLTVAELSELWTSDSSTRFEDLEALVYGNTPMQKAMEFASQRFEREPINQNETRILFVISDGEPTDGDPIHWFDQIKASGVSTVCCFVTDEDLAEPRKLFADSQSSWSSGAKLMFEAASPITPNGKLEEHLQQTGWNIQENSKLFVQANHTDVLDEFIRACGADIARSDRYLLPKGR